MELLLDADPGTLVLGTLLGEDQATILVLLLKDERLEMITYGDQFGMIGILADRKLAQSDDALGLETEVKQDLVAFDLHDGSGYQIPLIEFGKRSVDEIVHLVIGDIVELEDGRILNLTQRWTPFIWGPSSHASRGHSGTRTAVTTIRKTSSGPTIHHDAAYSAYRE